MSEQNMGEPFTGTGKPPEGYQPGDYVETPSDFGGWQPTQNPKWLVGGEYRLLADHFYYIPIWCLDKAAQFAGLVDWAAAKTTSKFTQASVIAHARTLRDGCEPMQEPVDPLVQAIKTFCEDAGMTTFTEMADALRARFDITPKGEAK